MIGRVFGKYRLVEMLGRGGMAEVYRAEHVLIGGQFAVKVLLPAVSRRPTIAQRLFNEARITATIGHPGIVRTFDFGVQDERAFLVMEYLKGESLYQRVRRERKLPVMTALGYTRQIASALKAAHDAGIVHRDLKPGNVFLVEDVEMPGIERVRILDFGIAKATMIPASDKFTQTGVIVGTPEYMSPEQCRARPVDHRTDQYSLGCILYRMLVGTTPFGRRRRESLLSCHVTQQPIPPRARDPEIPVEVEALVLRLLAKNPDDRYPDTAALLARLDSIGGDAWHTAQSGRASSPSGSRLLPVAPAPPISAVKPPRAPSPPHPFAAPSPSSGESAAPALDHVAPGSDFDPPPAPASAPYPRYREDVRESDTLAQASAAYSARFSRMPRPVRAGLWIGGAVALVAALALVGPLFGSEPDRAASAAGAAAAQAAEKGAEAAEAAEHGATAEGAGARDSSESGADRPASSSDAADAPEPPAAPIRIAIESTPTGAEVFQMPESVRIGKTPLTVERTPIAGELVLVVTAPGFQDVTITADAARSGAYSAVLEPLAAAASDGDAAAGDDRDDVRDSDARPGATPRVASKAGARRTPRTRPKRASRGGARARGTARPSSESAASTSGATPRGRAGKRGVITLDPFRRGKDAKPTRLDPFER